MRTRDEVESELEKYSSPTSKRPENGVTERLTVELLLDIRDLLDGLDTHAEMRRDDGVRFQRDLLEAVSALGRR